MPRIFKAPDHVTALITLHGERRANAKGLVSIEDGAPASEIQAFLSNGWQEQIAPPAPPAGKPASKPAGKKGRGGKPAGSAPTEPPASEPQS
jgi:hypothetical protein